MSLTPTHRLEQHRLADHSADGRMLLLAAMALVVGTGGACGAWVLLKMIEFATNLFWFGRLSAEPVEITDAALGLGTRSEACRVGNGGFGTWRFAGSPDDSKK